MNIYLKNILLHILRLLMTIPVMEFQAQGYKISKVLVSEWMYLKEISVSFKMKWWHGFKNWQIFTILK